MLIYRKTARCPGIAAGARTTLNWLHPAVLIVLGSLATASRATSQGFGPGGVHCNELPRLLDTLQHELKGPAFLLVKGSRAARMERVADALLGEA